MLLGVCIASCSDDSNNEAELKITERNMDITAVGGTMTVTLSIEGEKASSDQSWCSPSVSGKTVTLTLQPNVSLEGRTALVTVTKGMEKVAFPVTQPGNMVPTAGASSVQFDAHGGSKEIVVRNALPFNAVLKEGVTWLTARVEGNMLILTAQKNYTINALQTTVKLVSEGLESEFTVKQTGIALTPEKTSLVMFNEGDEKKVMVKSTLAFTAVSDQDWLTVTRGDDFVTLTATDNSGQPARTATVTLTSETLTATIKVTQRAPVYADFLGSWELTGYDSGSPFTFNLSIVQATAGSTYKVTGWGKSEIAIDSKYALEAVFDQANQVIYIMQQENLGLFTDEDGDYDVVFRGLVSYNGGYSLVDGKFICYIGFMQRDGTVQWINNTITLGSTKYELAGALYYLHSHADGKYYSYNVDRPFMYSPVMKKSTGVASTRSFVRTNKSKTSIAVENQLQVQN